MLATLCKRLDVRRFKTRECRTRRDGAPVPIRSGHGSFVVTLPHPRSYKHGLAKARSLPIQGDATKVGLPGQIDACAMLQRGESVPHVVGIWSRIGPG